MLIEALWIYPPLAFARLGGSDIPLESFAWGEDDTTPHGTGKTTIAPATTFEVADDSTLSSYLPDNIRFKDAQGFRPVCPFFELHARWSDAQGNKTEGAVTMQLLAELGLGLAQFAWTVQVANLKPFNMVKDPATRIGAIVDITGNNHASLELQGRAPAGAVNPLVPPDRYIPLGSVRLIKPSHEFPQVRLRFTPAKGIFYGPTNLKERWKDITLDERFLFLNKDSPWCSWKPTDDDPRGTPGGQYAQDDNAVSYGMVDDVCDGIIECTLKAGPWTANPAGVLARARIAVAPPDYAPDRRHLASLADGLKDRVDRAQ